ncbi:MAG TPA: prenyltransferase [Alphaproteobacteria bacterium]|nr:prenyltransferase [Alphaproteobacteria bacterium]
MKEPHPVGPATASLPAILSQLILATRPMFFTASVLPVLLGAAWGARGGRTLDGEATLIALVSIVLVHAAVNVLNDVYDELSGGDRINDDRIYPFTGGSRFIQNGVFSVRQMAHWGGVLLAAGCLAGLALFLEKGPTVLAFGAVGVFLGIAYSSPPLRLAGRGVGELAVGVGFGTLPVVGAAWLQQGQWEAGTFLLSVPVALWVALILLVNEIPDAAADAAVGKRTLVVRLGLDGTARLQAALHLLAAAAVAYLALRGALPLAAPLVPLLAAAAAARVAGWIREGGRDRSQLERAVRFTPAVHAAGTLWLFGCVLWPG